MKRDLPVNKEQVAAYERVRVSGRYNMIMESMRARRAARLSESAYSYILSHYSELLAVWPEIGKRGGA